MKFAGEWSAVADTPGSGDRGAARNCGAEGVPRCLNQGRHWLVVAVPELRPSAKAIAT